MVNQVEQLNNEGVRLFLSGKFKDAKHKYKEALKINPSYATTLNNLGMCSLQEQNYVEAENYFNDAINEKETDIYFLNLGHALANQGIFDQAEKKYIESIKINPHSLRAHKSLGSLYQKQKRYSESIKVWEKVISNYSRDPFYMLELVKDLIQLEDYQNALDVLFEMEGYLANKELTWYYMALIHLHLKNFGLAEKAIKKSIGLEPENKTFRSLLAAIYLGVSDIKKAIEQWDYILLFEADNTKVRIDKAVALLSYGFMQEALKTLDFVLNKDGKNDKALFYKALTLLEITKNDENAIKILKKISKSSDTIFSDRAIELLSRLIDKI